MIDLTDRQREVLDLICAGHSYPAVAARLGISESGVKNHVDALHRRLATAQRTRTGLVAAAFQHGLVSVE